MAAAGWPVMVEREGWCGRRPVAAGLAFLVAGIRRDLAIARAARELAWRDPLTGLPGRREFEQRLAEALADGRRHGRPPGLILCDLDHLGAINRERGRAAGDRVLTAAAWRLRRAAGQGDLACRIGGDEFALILAAGSAAGALAAAVCEELRQALPGIGLSAGAACGQRDETPAELVARTDAACRRAKVAGGGRAVVADEDAPVAPPPSPATVPRRHPRRPRALLVVRLLHRRLAAVRIRLAATAAARDSVRHDPVTGCWQRWYGRARLAGWRAAGTSVSLLRCEVVELKDRNRREGLRAGDELLRRVATLLATGIRRGDLLCRWEGSAFVLILPGCNAAGAQRVRERLQGRLAAGGLAGATDLQMIDGTGSDPA
jgi:diguanylate cyclase (GGDEF)-like protein